MWTSRGWRGSTRRASPPQAIITAAMAAQMQADARARVADISRSTDAFISNDQRVPCSRLAPYYFPASGGTSSSHGHGSDPRAIFLVPFFSTLIFITASYRNWLIGADLLLAGFGRNFQQPRAGIRTSRCGDGFLDDLNLHVHLRECAFVMTTADTSCRPRAALRATTDRDRTSSLCCPSSRSGSS